ncbi:MAG: hypothetical protein JWO86_3967 [Myxococcaceae bacterium]|nr:hypothetical protein [Myxococcaceae bacterium]MEA2746423.1 hypothetical protein [Myxococcales bacterium]
MSDDACMRFPKRCACGAVWTARTWTTLSYAGRMSDEIDDVELRHCTCGSTISMPIAAVRDPRHAG